MLGNVRYINQPFCHYTLPVRWQAAASQESSIFLSLDQEEEDLVKKYISDLLSGRMSVNSRWDFWQPSFWFKPDRMVLKIVNAKGLIEWIGSHFQGFTLYQIRHPIAQALSVEKAAGHLHSCFLMIAHL